MTGGAVVLAVGAHPDDVELGCGGTLARLGRLGLETAALDLTRGELGSRGNPETRAAEAARAAALLGLGTRRNLGLPDGGIDPGSAPQQLACAAVLRELRPRLLLLPWIETRHPDHSRTAALLLEAAFRAGLHRLDAPGEPFRPALVMHYMERVPFRPTLVIDVSAEHAVKMAAIRAYASQFERKAEDPEPATFLTRPEFLESIVARDRFYGDQAGFHHGEPFRLREPLAVGSDLLAALLGGRA